MKRTLIHFKYCSVEGETSKLLQIVLEKDLAYMLDLMMLVLEAPVFSAKFRFLIPEIATTQPPWPFILCIMSLKDNGIPKDGSFLAFAEILIQSKHRGSNL